MTGASYFASVLSNAGGNVAQALGMYNGWRLGLSTHRPFAPTCLPERELTIRGYTIYAFNSRGTSNGCGTYRLLLVPKQSGLPPPATERLVTGSSLFRNPSKLFS